MAQLHFEDVNEGDELPVMVKNASRAQLFLFSAATQNPHRIHYDRDYAAVEGHPDVLVHGPLQGAWLAQFVTDWAGPAGRVLQVGWQNRARAFPEQDLTWKGTVVRTHREGDRGIVELEIAEQNPEGQALVPATARVSLPLRS
jgi:hydroxyacyl-ACP dehydratase HTD2-like protein with hotdog domain